MKKTLFRFLAGVLALGTAQGQPAIEWTGSQDFRFNTTVPILSWRFLSGCDYDLEITALGFYDHEGDGLLGAHTVSVAPANGGPAVASATVPAGTNAAMEGHFRYVPIAPVKLARGTDYVITSTSVGTPFDAYAFRAQSVVPNRYLYYRGAGEVSDPDGLSPGLFGPNCKVRATAELAPATIRTSEVEICWEAKNKTIYQVQYRTSADSGEWLSLGQPVEGFDQSKCVRDSVSLDQPRRFYRVLTLCYE